jgi:hypothetical protein
MRLPRIKLTIGHLVIAVAVVALNCWVYRLLESTSRSQYDSSLWQLPEAFLIGSV